MAETPLFVFLVFFSIFISGSREDHLVKEVGAVVKMETKKPVLTFYDFYWKFNDENVILFSNKQTVEEFGSFINRTEFNKETYMLTLKNLKKTDSGDYGAKASGDDIESLTNHTLIVIDAVEMPNLTCLPDESTCNIAVCEGQNSTISCTKENCEKKEEKSGDITLSLFIKESTIICNQSNAVHWKHDEHTMKKGEKNAASDPYPRLPWPVLGAVMIITQSVLYII